MRFRSLGHISHISQTKYCFWYIKIQSHRPLRPPEISAKFQILFVKTFSLKQKANKILPTTTKKSNFVSSRKQPHVRSHYNFQFCELLRRYKLQRGNVKEKPFRQIQVYSCICRHIQVYSNIIMHIEQLFRHIHEFTTLFNPGIFTTLAYSETCHIHNTGVFRTLAYLQP